MKLNKINRTLFDLVNPLAIIREFQTLADIFLPLMFLTFFKIQFPRVRGSSAFDQISDSTLSFVPTYREPSDSFSRSKTEGSKSKTLKLFNAIPAISCITFIFTFS